MILTNKPVLTLYKPLGKTPYEMVRKVKGLFPELADKKIGYAGRLDPMAHGVLVLLIGDANKKKHLYEGLPKEYMFEAVFGVSTDSYDLLGKITDSTENTDFSSAKKTIEKNLKKYQGSFIQTFPPYSAVRFKGKPLYYWQRRGELAPGDIPRKTVTIDSLELLSVDEISIHTLSEIIHTRISRVQGNFRQEEILQTWKKYFQTKTQGFLKARFHIRCSSGTYVRSIVDDLGKTTGLGATTFSILRTAVGPFTLEHSTIT